MCKIANEQQGNKEADLIPNDQRFPAKLTDSIPAQQSHDDAGIAN